MSADNSQTAKTRLRCSCGAEFEVAPSLVGKKLVCSKCGSQITTQPSTPAAQVDIRATEVNEPAVCPICQTTIDPIEAVHTCQTCQQVHHAECWNEVGGCATYGCKEAPADDKSEQAAAARTSAWGDTKRCPACGEVIKAIALRCRYCKTDFESVDPMTTADLRKQAVTGDKVAGLKQMVVGLFVASLIGVLAPLVLIFGLIYLLPRRALLAKSGPIFVIIGWTAVVLSAVFCILFMLMIVFSG